MDLWSADSSPLPLACALACALLVSHSAHAAFEGVRRLDYDEPFGSWVTALPDGRLMTWWPEEVPGTVDETGANQVAYARFSPNSGATWTEPEVLFDFPRTQGKARYDGTAIGGILVDAEGGLHIFGRRIAGWSWEAFHGEAVVFHVWSDDNCRTWSDVQPLPSPYSYNGMHMPVLLRSGRIVLPMWHAFDDRRDWGSVCFVSDDRGRTWRSTGEMGPDLKDEQSGVQLADGRVWMLFRKYEGGRLLEASSSDEGESWHDIGESRFIAPASPPALRRLQDGRILLIWNNSQKPKHVFNRLVLAAAISPDEGKTWYGYREIARTDGTPGPDGWVCYPFITLCPDGTVIVTYGTAGFKANLLRLDPDWLMEATLHDDFSGGLDNWVTLRTEGVDLVEDPQGEGRTVLSIRKPNPDVAAGVSLNFPFGGKGSLEMTLRLETGFQGARLCLTDHFTWPSYKEDGAFAIDVWAGGELVEPVGAGEISRTRSSLEPETWHRLLLAWDCVQQTCTVSLDGRQVTELSQLLPAAGVCYLRLWSAADGTDEAGMLVESVRVTTQP